MAHIVMLAPVEYLTYGSRNRRRVFRLPRRSVSIRIVIAFYRFETYFCANQTLGKIQEGGISPLLGRFTGDCKGGESKLPLCHSFFQPSTALSFSCEKESGVETFPAHSVRERPRLWRVFALRAKEASPPRGDKTASFGRGSFSLRLWRNIFLDAAAVSVYDECVLSNRRTQKCSSLLLPPVCKRSV